MNALLALDSGCITGRVTTKPIRSCSRRGHSNKGPAEGLS